MSDLEHEVLKAWHQAELNSSRLYIDGMDEAQKTQVLVEAKFKGLKDALVLIVREIEQIHAHLHEALPIAHDDL